MLSDAYGNKIATTLLDGGAVLSSAVALAFGLTLAILVTNCFGVMWSDSVYENRPTSSLLEPEKWSQPVYSSQPISSSAELAPQRAQLSRYESVQNGHQASLQAAAVI